MNLYYRDLKRIGICTILIAVANLIYELLIRQYLVDAGSPYASYIPLPWGIWVKNLIGVAAGLTALLLHLKKHHYAAGYLILLLLCAAEAVIIMLSMTGAARRRTNGFFDITMLMMVLLTYTQSQTDRGLRHWLAAQSHAPVTLDLRLTEQEDFFDPVQMGPKMALNRDYASVISRFVASMRTPAPLQINLLCAEHVSEVTRSIMKEVLVMHYEAEEARIAKSLEKRYRRVLRLVALSVFVVGVVRQTSLFTDEMILWDIVVNFAAFGLWQIGYTHYERNEDYDGLLAVHIAGHADLRFIDR